MDDLLSTLTDVGNLGRGGALAVAAFVGRHLLTRGDNAAAEHLKEIRSQRDHYRARVEQLEVQLEELRHTLEMRGHEGAGQ